MENKDLEKDLATAQIMSIKRLEYLIKIWTATQELPKVFMNEHLCDRQIYTDFFAESRGAIVKAIIAEAKDLESRVQSLRQQS